MIIPPPSPYRAAVGLSFFPHEGFDQTLFELEIPASSLYAYVFTAVVVVHSFLDNGRIGIGSKQMSFVAILWGWQFSRFGTGIWG